MRFHNGAIDQVQTVARFCCESIEDTLPHPSPRPAVEPIVRTRVRAIAFGQIAPRDPGPQHVKYCIYDPSIVRARALATLRHQRLKNRSFLIAEIESHDPPPPAVNHDPCCFSVNYAGTDPSHATCSASYARNVSVSRQASILRSRNLSVTLRNKAYGSTILRPLSYIDVATVFAHFISLCAIA